MSPPLDRMVEDALSLPRESRAFLAEKLLESLDYDEDFGISPEWLSEIRRRCREIDEGRAELVPAAEVFAEAKRRLG